jgi:hypothetical protein
MRVGGHRIDFDASTPDMFPNGTLNGGITLPFPFIAVMWFDISFVQSTRGHHLLPASEVDHSASIMHILDRIGFDHQKAEDYIRIFGYAPRDYTDFDKNEK